MMFLLLFLMLLCPEFVQADLFEPLNLAGPYLRGGHRD